MALRGTVGLSGVAGLMALRAEKLASEPLASPDLVCVCGACSPGWRVKEGAPEVIVGTGILAADQSEGGINVSHALAKEN